MPETISFPSIPLYRDSISNNNYLDYLKQINYHRNSNNDGYLSDNLNILESDHLYNLKQEIIDHVNNYIFDIVLVQNDVKVEIQDSWVMKHVKDDFAPMHYHHNSLLSGIVYLACDILSGELVFHRESNNRFFPSVFNFNYKEYNSYNADTYSILPEKNDIILFPSHLQHSVTASKSNNDRYCIAFNVYLRGKLGTNFADATDRLLL